MTHRSSWGPARVLLAGMALVGAAGAQLLRVDAGDLNGYARAQAGWELLLTASSSPPGIGLFPPAVDTVRVAQFFPGSGTVAFPSNVLTVDPDQVGELHRLSALRLADKTVLTIEGLAPGAPHRVRLLLGAPAPWMKLVAGEWIDTPTTSRDVRVEIQEPGSSSPPVSWRTAASGLDCISAYAPATLATEFGGIVTLWLRARADGAGTLRLRFSTDGGDPVFLNAFEVHADEALPVRYKRTAGAPLQAVAPAAAPFAAAFNAHDYAGAEALAQGLADPWLRGVALLHLVGWLDGSADDRARLLPDAQSALAAALAAGHAGAAWLLDEAASFARADAHIAARGYASAFACADSGGLGYLNPACAGQVTHYKVNSNLNANMHIARRELAGLAASVGGATALDQLVLWNAGAVPADAWEPSPLVFAALKRRATAVVLANSLLSAQPSDPLGLTLLDEFSRPLRDLVDLGFAAADFPRDHELPLLRQWAVLGVSPSMWTAGQAQLLSDAQIAASWWAPHVVVPSPVVGASGWANAQRRFSRLGQALTRWWFTERLLGDELGGGQGDDVEALAALALVTGPIVHTGGGALRDVIDQLAQHGLEESVWVSDGMYAGPLTDVEHAAEFTTNPWLATRLAFGRTPRAFRTALGVAQHLQGGASLAAPTQLGRLHFKSAWFSLTGPSTEPDKQFDWLLDGRQMLPATVELRSAPLQASHPLVTGLLAWAAAWRDDALDTTAIVSGKPVGFHGPVQWPSNLLGLGGVWYSDKGNVDDLTLFTTVQVSYVAELLRVAYHASSASDRWRFLLPAVRQFRAVKDWEDAGQPAGATGGTHWAAAQLRANPNFGQMVIAHLPDLQADANLQTQPDPLQGGLPYVDAALLDRLGLWAREGFYGQSAAMRYALTPVVPCAIHTAKPTGSIEAPFADASAFFRNVFPLLTRYVAHTDRITANPFNAAFNYVDAAQSGNLTEGQVHAPLLRWRAAPGVALDLAVLVNGRDPAGTGASAFVHNFSALPAALTLELESGLAPARYSVAHGAADPTCDTVPLGVPLTTAIVDKPGHGASVPLLLPPGLSLVTVVKLGPPLATLATHDLALDPPSVRLVTSGTTTQIVASVRIANRGRSTSPSTQLTLHVAGLNADGSLLPLTLPGPELLVGSQSVSLPPTTGFVASEQTITLSAPAPAGLLSAVTAGLGLHVRAAAAATAGEPDPLNNASARGFSATQIEITRN